MGCQGGDGSGAEAGDETKTPAAEAEAEAGGAVATVTGISGPGGLTSSALQPGAFLGKGAVLNAGQTVETPRGTLAELQLSDGTKLRLNEDTAVKVPSVKWPRRFELTRGEMVAITAAGAEAVEVAAGEELLTVAAGEAQVRNVGDGRRYAVVSGNASLKTPSKTLDLGPGESLDAPLPEDTYEKGPELSLAALDETAWTRTFASAARMTETVPRGVGSLTARRAGSNREQQKLRLTDQAITVNIAGRVAHTEIEQAFFNDRAQVLEGIYRFPLPSDGSISGLGLLVGNRWMEGEVLEKQRARNIFKQIVDATIPRDPALLEWEQGNLFKLRVFPIPGRGERKVRLSYTQVLPVVAGKLRYRFPMGGSGAGGTPIDNFAFNVNIDRSELDTQQLAQIDTPMLALDQSLDGDTVKLSTTVKNFIPTSDLGIDVPLAAAAHRVHAATHLDRDGQAYFMLALRPEFDAGRSEGPSNIAFVVDRSHSTTPELWTMAQGIVQAMAGTLSADDRFTVLACDTACNQMTGGLVPTSVASLTDAGDFLAEQDLAGASDLGGMMRAGADALVSAPAGERVIVYLGDGAPTSGALAPDELAANLRGPMQGTRVLAVALGARSDLTSLGSVLEATGGEVVRADPRDDVRDLVRDLSLRARVPMVGDLELDLPDGMLMVRKQGSTGLRKDDTLLVTGKLSHPVSGEVRLRGRGADGPVEASFPVELSATRDGAGASSVHQHLPRTWAQLQIAHLTKTRGAEAREDIIALSQDFNVLSRFTAMLVLENDAMFREFNVVRREKDKDRWDGKLPTPEEPSDSTVRAEVTEDGNVDTKTRSLDNLLDSGLGKKGSASGPATGATATPKQDPKAEPEPEPEPDLPAFSSGRSQPSTGADKTKDAPPPPADPAPAPDAAAELAPPLTSLFSLCFRT
ncbi:MAG: VIT domain-containing protein, partial [Myxococcota bacterium]